MQSRNQYLKVLKERYIKAKAKKEKTQILDEYCRNTGQARKYVIRKIQSGVDLRPKQRKKRKQTYDGQVTAALAKVWHPSPHSLCLSHQYQLQLYTSPTHAPFPRRRRSF
jgi:hypothetical protein